MSLTTQDAGASTASNVRYSRFLRAFNANQTSWIGAVLCVLVVVAAIAAPILATHDPNQQNLMAALQSPSATYWLGTDQFGRDIYSRILYGAQVSLFIGLASTGLAMIAGTIIGLTAGWYGGRYDAIVMQVMDIFLAFPSLILGLMIVAMLGPSLTNIILAIALTSVPAFARIARAPAISLKEREFVEASKSFGSSDLRAILVHVFPNALPEVLVMSSLWLANAIRTEASLAFVGLGIKPPTATWGAMIRDGFDNILDSYSLALAPSIAILIVIFALNLLGDGLRDAIDPKSRGEN